MSVKLLFVFAAIFFVAQVQAQYACVWYRSAPFCGTGNDCPNSYAYMMYHADSAGNANYCSNSFGSKCWTGEKNLCCNAFVTLSQTNSYTCGSF